MTSEREWSEWRRHPVTQWLLNKIKDKEEEQVKAWREGNYLHNSQLCDEITLRVMIYEEVRTAEYTDWLDDEERAIYIEKKGEESE